MTVDDDNNHNSKSRIIHDFDKTRKSIKRARFR